MSVIIDSLLHALQTAISKQSTEFEATKANITRTLLRPAAILIGSEAVIVGLFGAIKLLRLQAGGALLELVGSASENMLLLTGMIVTTYFGTLGANIYRSYLAQKSQERIVAMAMETNKGENFKTLSSQYKRYIENGQFGEARAIANWMMSRYPNEVEKDPDLISLIARDMPRLETITTRPPELPSR